MESQSPKAASNIETINIGSKKHGRYTSQSVDSSDSESSSRNEKHRRSGKRRKIVSTPQFEILSQQVAFLTNLICNHQFGQNSLTNNGALANS